MSDKRASALEKAALVLMAIKTDAAAKILKSMSKEERIKLSKAMSSLGAVSGQEFDSTVKEAVGFLRSSSQIVGNTVNARDFLSNALSEDEANEIIANLEWSVWEKISRLDADLVVSYLQKEHVQVVSVILSLMQPEATSKVLAKLSESTAEQVMLRLSVMQEIDKEFIAIIESVLLEELGHIANQSEGTKLVMNLFNNFDRASEEKFIKVIEKHDETLANTIKKGMFSFDDLAKLNDTSIRNLLRELPQDKLIVALKGASADLSSLIYKNMSERAARILKGDIEARGPVRVSEVEEAQGHIAKVAKRLIKEGLILFGADVA